MDHLPNKTPDRPAPFRNLLVQPDVSCSLRASAPMSRPIARQPMHAIIYLIGLIVVIMAILSLFGLR
jgi:hypothetical protein